MFQYLYQGGQWLVLPLHEAFNFGNFLNITNFPNCFKQSNQ